jgi:aspartyl-tRNA(Asn)/glutamyl-tRNA(Gln) amidotransferase subunit A
VGDAAALLHVIAGHDPRDATSADRHAPRYGDGLDEGVSGMKLGLPKEYVVAGTDPEVTAAVKAACRDYERLGAQVVEVSLPHTEHALATYYLIATAEASANLARYDGVRFGHRAEAQSLGELYARSRAQGFGAEVKRRIMLGTYALSAGYYDAYYLRAQKVRTLIRDDFARAFKKVDALVAPASPVPAFKLGEKVGDPLAMYLVDVLTLPTSLAGLPGMSVPCGFTQGGLPIGLQLIGPAFEEGRLLRIARAYEREHDWAARSPAL